MSFDRNLFGDQVETVERAMAELQLKTAAHSEGWGLNRADWAANLQDGTLTFINESFKATTPVQVIGTFSNDDDSWLWGWDHPSVPSPCAEAARAVKAWAEEHRLPGLLERTTFCSLDDAWAFTALAMYLTDAQGGYSGPAGTARVFMTFGKVALTHP